MPNENITLTGLADRLDALTGKIDKIPAGPPGPQGEPGPQGPAFVPPKRAWWKTALLVGRDICAVGGLGLGGLAYVRAGKALNAAQAPAADVLPMSRTGTR